MTFLSHDTRNLLADASTRALDEGRAAGMPDWQAREEFVRAAGVAFDVAAEPEEDADPEPRADAQP